MARPFYPRDVLPESFRVVRATNDLLIAENGDRHIDLLSGSGTVLLGHGHPEIVAGVRDQLELLWNTGALPTRPTVDAHAAVERYFPSSHRLAGLYSTGMEAAEFALRVSRQVTGRKAIVGFDGSMHGKSMATARLGWPNDLVTMPDFHRLAYLPHRPEDEIIENVRRVLTEHAVAAVFLEPLLGSRGAYMPSRSFAQQLAALCKEHGALLVVDEILTGFHRTGGAFLHRDLGITPDITLIGKAMGNGFPVSGVVVDRRHPADAGTLPGSTYADNPLAAAAVCATLGAMQRDDMPTKVAAVEAQIVAQLGAVRELGVALRGKGALWILELPSPDAVARVTARILAGGVVVSPTANFVRLLPAATITPDHLAKACGVIRDACRAELGTGR